MKIFDENGILIKNPDLEKGQLVRHEKPIVHRYKVTVEEQGHYETIKEYPNGGKDVEWVVEVPEEGHWETYDEVGNVIETDIVIPADAPHELDINDTEEIYVYIPYTEEELAELAKVIEPEPTADELLNAISRGLGYE